MGMYDNSSMLDDLKWELRYGSNLNRLIMVNLIVFAVVVIVRIVVAGFMQDTALYDQITSWISVQKNPIDQIWQPWSVISYMFFHEGFLHILFNLLWLFYFGKLFTLFLEDKRIVPVYLLGGLAGVLGFWGFSFLAPHMVMGKIMLGASAAIMAIVFTVVTFRPNHSMHLVFLGAVKIKWIGLFLICSDIFAISLQNNTGGSIAHLAGALFGFAYAKQLANGTDVAMSLNNLWERLTSKQDKSSKMKVVHRKPKPVPTTVGKRKADDEYHSRNSNKQQRMDQILEKISRTSIDSLTREEKDFLHEMSKEL